jgi:hypothetical protein
MENVYVATKSDSRFKMDLHKKTENKCVREQTFISESRLGMEE